MLMRAPNCAHGIVRGRAKVSFVVPVPNEEESAAEMARRLRETVHRPNGPMIASGRARLAMALKADGQQ